MPNDTQNSIFIFVDGVWIVSKSICMRSKLSISLIVFIWLRDVCTSFMLFCSMEISLARVAKSSCNYVKLSPCTISISLIRSSMAVDRSGIEKETFTSDSSVGRIGAT